MTVICSKKIWNMHKDLPLQFIAFTTGNILMLWEPRSKPFFWDLNYIIAGSIFPLLTHYFPFHSRRSHPAPSLEPLQIIMCINKFFTQYQTYFVFFNFYYINATVPSMYIYIKLTHSLVTNCWNFYYSWECERECAFPIVPIQCVYLQMHVIKWRMWNNSSQ